jgi:hypothetical protein
MNKQGTSSEQIIYRVVIRVETGGQTYRPKVAGALSKHFFSNRPKVFTV